MARYLSPEWVETFDAALRTLDLSDVLAAAGQGSLAAADGAFRVVQVVTGVPPEVAGAAGGSEVRVVLTVEGGRARLERQRAGDRDGGTATIVVGYRHALALARGDLDPADALADGLVRVRGDLAALVAGQDVLAAASAQLGDALAGLTDPADPSDDEAT